MDWTFKQCEDAAATLRAIAEIESDAVVPATAIASALSLKCTLRAPRGCTASVTLDDDEIHLHCRGYPWTRNFGIAHELCHIALELEDATRPHDEAQVDWAAVALLIPAGAMRVQIAANDLTEAAALAAAFPLVPREWVILRAGWVRGRAVVVHVDRHRRAWAPEGYPMPDVAPYWEMQLVRLVRVTMQRQRAFGGEAFPIGAVGAAGVLVIYPEAENEGW